MGLANTKRIIRMFVGPIFENFLIFDFGRYFRIFRGVVSGGVLEAKYGPYSKIDKIVTGGAINLKTERGEVKG